MKETELTVQVYNSLEETKSILENKGFVFVKQFVLNDFYFSNKQTAELEKVEYIDIINNSILLRDITGDVKETELIFKNKELDFNGNVVAEEKIKSKVENYKNTKAILLKSGLTCWCNLIQNLFIYKKDNTELAIQSVDDLGLFIEYEEEPNMKNLSKEEKFEKMKQFLLSLNLKIGNDFSCKKVYLKLKNK